MSGERILVCDDDDDVRAVVCMSLEVVGEFSVVAVSKGEEALAAFVASPPDLVILDVMMPAMDGPTTLARLRELPGGASVPVVFLSAKSQRSELDNLRDLGVRAVLEKPFDPMTLPDRIRGVLAASSTSVPPHTSS